MKKVLFTVLLFTITSNFLTAQDTVYLRKEGKKKIFTDRPPQTIFAEVAGPGFVPLSVSYDARFKKQIGGLGWRAGIGYSFSSYSVNFTVVPVGINYLLGDKTKGRFLELGLNESLIVAGKSSSSYDYISDTKIYANSTYLITSITIGYRSQPTKTGFSFRAGLDPFIGKSDPELGAHLSFGYSF